MEDVTAMNGNASIACSRGISGRNIHFPVGFDRRRWGCEFWWSVGEGGVYLFLGGYFVELVC